MAKHTTKLLKQKLYIYIHTYVYKLIQTIIVSQ